MIAWKIIEGPDLNMIVGNLGDLKINVSSGRIVGNIPNRIEVLCP